MSVNKINSDGSLTKIAGSGDVSNKADRSELDIWVASSTVSSGTISFSGIDDTGNNGYELFIDVTSSSSEKNPTGQISSISGTGTSSMSVTYTTNADNGATGKLRLIK